MLYVGAMEGISVVIPVFNRKLAVTQAINSVLAQTYPVQELIIVDDGSTDNLQTALKWTTQDPRVRYIYQENQGVSAARNAGIHAAKCSWIALLDSDDEWLAGKIEKQMACIRQNPHLKIVHTDEIWIRGGKRVNQCHHHEKFGGWIFQKCLPLCAMSPSSILIHRSVFHHVGLFDESLPACEDYDLWLRITCKYPVGYLAEPLIKKYGGHDDQLSRAHWGMDRFRIKSLVKALNRLPLSCVERQQARSVLKKKLEILIGGCQKHGRTTEEQSFRELLNQWFG